MHYYSTEQLSILTEPAIYDVLGLDLLREAVIKLKVFFCGPATKGGKGWPLRKNNFFEALKKNLTKKFAQKKGPLSSRGVGKALVAGTQKKYFFAASLNVFRKSLFYA